MAHYSEKTLSSEPVFNGKIVRVTRDMAQLPDGRSAVREVVHHIGGAGIVALNEKGEVALVRQYRYAAGCELIEIPAGKLEPGEDPMETARRELAEEAGLAAAKLVPFGQIIPTCAYCTEVIYNFLATGLSAVPRHLDEDEFIDVFWLPLDEAAAMVMDGRISDGKTVAALLRAALLKAQGRLQLG